MNIHIVPHGKDTNHIKTGLRFYDGVDKVYLLTSKKYLETAYKLREKLQDFGYTSDIREIDAFDLRNVVDSIVDIARIHKEDKLHINITGGTNLMAGAATASAFFIGATAYYVLEKKDEKQPITTLVKELPIPTQPLYLDIKGLKRKVLETLWKMDEKGTIKSITELCNKLDVSPQSIHFHLKDLERKNFVKIHQEGRVKKIEITQVAKLYLRWTMKNKQEGLK